MSPTKDPPEKAITVQCLLPPFTREFIELLVEQRMTTDDAMLRLDLKYQSANYRRSSANYALDAFMTFYVLQPLVDDAELDAANVDMARKYCKYDLEIGSKLFREWSRLTVIPSVEGDQVIAQLKAVVLDRLANPPRWTQEEMGTRRMPAAEDSATIGQDTLETPIGSATPLGPRESTAAAFPLQSPATSVPSAQEASLAADGDDSGDGESQDTRFCTGCHHEHSLSEFLDGHEVRKRCSRCRAMFAKGQPPRTKVKASPFTSLEDKVIIEGVAAGYRAPRLLSQLPGRTGEQVRMRIRTLRTKGRIPLAGKTPNWTQAEKNILLNARMSNMKVKQILDLLPNRTESAITSKLHAPDLRLVDPMYSPSREWSSQEELTLIGKLNEGPLSENWIQYFEGRTCTAIRAKAADLRAKGRARRWD